MVSSDRGIDSAGQANGTGPDEAPAAQRADVRPERGVAACINSAVCKVLAAESDTAKRTTGATAQPYCPMHVTGKEHSAEIAR